MKTIHIFITSCAFLNFFTNANVIIDYRSAVKNATIYPTLPIISFWTNNTKCLADSQRLLLNVQNKSNWAMHMLDASTRSAVGVLKGRVYQLGDYDECIETVYPVQGRYCLVTVTVTPPKEEVTKGHEDRHNPRGSIWNKIRNVGNRYQIQRNVVYWALCVPKSCTHDDVEASLNHHLAEKGRTSGAASVSVAVDPALCRSNDELPTSTDTLIFCGITVFIVLCVITSTVFDYCSSKSQEFSKPKRVAQYFLSFSAKRNLADLSTRGSNNDTLNCIDGIKFLSMCLIIIYHRLGITIASPIQNYEFVEKESNKFWTHLIYQGDVVVDTFFLLSGLMLAYISILKEKCDLFLGIIFRYVRLTPSYVVMVFFGSSLMYQMGDGPLWDSKIGPERIDCRENWWANLLYVNNYVNADNICLIHTWFLACDFHFFIIGLCILKLLQRNHRAGCTVLCGTIILSIAVPFIITCINKVEPLLFFTRKFLEFPKTDDYFRTMYIKSHARASPYFVGIATGCILTRYSHLHKKFKSNTSLGLFVSFVICVTSLIPGCIFNSPGWEYNVVEASFTAGFRRFLWATGMAVFILTLIWSDSSVLKTVLSSSPMVPLCKLSYGAYLVHIVMQTMHLASMRTSFHISHFNLIHTCMGDIICSMVFSLLLYLTVEAPTKSIFKQALSKQNKEALKSPNKLTR